MSNIERRIKATREDILSCYSQIELQATIDLAIDAGISYSSLRDVHQRAKLTATGHTDIPYSYRISDFSIERMKGYTYNVMDETIYSYCQAMAMATTTNQEDKGQ